MFIRFLITCFPLVCGPAAAAQVLFRDSPAARHDSIPASFSVTRLGSHANPDPASNPESIPLIGLSDQEVAAWLDSLVSSPSEGESTMASHLSFWSSLPYQLPLSRTGGVRLSSRYGLRTHPILRVKRHHDGIDLATPANAPVYVTADGMVEWIQRAPGMGLSVKVRHAHGLQSVYGHLSQASVRAGQSIRRGQQVGSVGSTGRSTGPHLHYALRLGGRFIDPLRFSALVRAHLGGNNPR